MLLDEGSLIVLFFYLVHLDLECLILLAHQLIVCSQLLYLDVKIFNQFLLIIRGSCIMHRRVEHGGWRNITTWNCLVMIRAMAMLCWGWSLLWVRVRGSMIALVLIESVLLRTISELISALILSILTVQKRWIWNQVIYYILRRPVQIHLIRILFQLRAEAWWLQLLFIIIKIAFFILRFLKLLWLLFCD